MMSPSWLEIFFMGLPALISSLVASLIGVITKRASLVLLGAILIAPFAWGQAWYILILTVPLILLGASLAIRRKMNQLSWILFLLSFSVLTSWLVIGIFTQ